VKSNAQMGTFTGFQSKHIRQIWGGNAVQKASYREGTETMAKSPGAVAVLVCLSLHSENIM